MKAWNFTKSDCDQETGMEYSTIVQVIVKDDRRKAWHWVSCKMTYYHVSDEKKQYKFSVCILSAVCILYLVCIFYPVCGLRSAVCGLQSAFCTDQIDIAVFVQASLKSGPKYWSSEKIWSHPSALSLGHRVCWNEPATGPPRCTFRLLDSSCIFRSSQMWSELLFLLKAIQLFFPREFLNFIEINFDFH